MYRIFDHTAFIKTIGIIVACTAFTACSAKETDSIGQRLPSDNQVVADVTPRGDDRVVEVNVVAGKPGEAYLHGKDRAWYFDRGVVVKRKADLAGFPDAVVSVGGLARYVHTDDGYQYLQFLTTYNAYEGIPAPSEEELAEFVGANLDKVFLGRAHNILGIESVGLNPVANVDWHTPTSFSASFVIRYHERRNNTTIEQRDGVFDVRFYKQTVDAAVSGLNATERSRTVVASKTRNASDIEQMKSLATNFL